jgi:signal transduction histidine kinase
VKQLKVLASKIRPQDLDVLGLQAALRQHIRQVSHKIPLKIHFTDTTHGTTVAPEIQTVLFRIVQECLNNVIKHAEAQQVRVRLSAPKNQLRLTITDDGKGFDCDHPAAKQDRPLGLLAMQEMIAGLGGMLKITSTPGKGVTVGVTVPTNRDESVGREPK